MSRKFDRRGQIEKSALCASDFHAPTTELAPLFIWPPVEALALKIAFGPEKSQTDKQLKLPAQQHLFCCLYTRNQALVGNTPVSYQ